MPETAKERCVITKIRVLPEAKNAFVDWQSKLHAQIATFPGFVSLEILFPAYQAEWVLIQRFSTRENVALWRQSSLFLNLLEQLQPLLDNSEANPIEHEETDAYHLKGGVTQVFVTKVSPEKEKDYREWIAKMHQVEATFPGFRGIYVQSPTPGESHNWITFLQFDTSEHLDQWLSSSERKQVLNRSNSLISSLESHRVTSGYAGWFSTISERGEAPPVWKQTMIVLLVLFPIIMLELRFLSPWLHNLDSSLATFIGNALSVCLISWPMMPIAIRFLGWWLSPKPENRYRATMIGTCVVLLLYLLEITFFWGFLR